MPTVDEAWTRLSPVLEEWRRDVTDQPDKSWDERQAFLLNLLDLREPEDDPAIAALVDHLRELPEDDRTQVLGSEELERVAYDLLVRHTPADEPPAAEYDPAVWNEYLTTNGPSWNGTDESWREFADWFLYYAGERGVTEPATALIEYLATQPVPARIETFAQYGVAIQAPADAQPAAEAGLNTALAEAVTAVPGAEHLSEADLAEVLAEVRDRLAKERPSA
ncbi:hypothetical protein [Actinophytocola sediminis]